MRRHATNFGGGGGLLLGTGKTATCEFPPPSPSHLRAARHASPRHGNVPRTLAMNAGGDSILDKAQILKKYALQ